MDSVLIDGLALTELRQINDKRGSVLHMMRNDSPEFTQFGECYFSEVLPCSIKAWKRHHLQTQNIAVPVGRIRIVIYDDRKKSSSHGKLQVLELGRPDQYQRLQIPPLLWYGFSCISTIPALLANCADLPHAPEESDLIPFDSIEIPYHWNI
jgi:dTDP-4-dehydrorhamnose 3,5-epimerase